MSEHGARDPEPLTAAEIEALPLDERRAAYERRHDELLADLQCSDREGADAV